MGAAHDASPTFARRRRSLLWRAITVSIAAMIFVAGLATASTIVRSNVLSRIVDESGCIEDLNAQLLRVAEMRRRVRELQFSANDRSGELEEAAALRLSLVSWAQTGRRLTAKARTARSEQGAIGAPFAGDIRRVLAAIDRGTAVSESLRHAVDVDAQDFAVVEGDLLERTRETQRADQRSLEVEQRIFSAAIAFVVIALSFLLVGPPLRRTAAILEDLTREDEASKREATDRALEAIFAQSRTGVALVRNDGAVLQANAALATMLAIDEAPYDGLASVVGALFPFFDGGAHRFPMEFSDTNGTRRSGDASITPVAELVDGSRTFLLVLEDITERRVMEDRLRHEASVDSLTELENRRAMRTRIAEAQAAAATGFVVLVDLDDFKLINDNGGHIAGDEVLVEVARRLRATSQPDVFAGRMGGDEFVILALHLDATACEKLLARILERIAHPIATTNGIVTVTASIGAATIVLAPEDSPDEASLDRVLRNADLALYRAKDLGRNRYAIDCERDAGHADLHVLGPAEIRDGLVHDAFVLHYQPIVDARRGTCVALEALVRWKRDEGALLPPSAFIAMAERSGTIVPLGFWILERACRDFAAMIADGLDEQVDLHVNVSPLQIAQDDFPERVAAVLAATGIVASRLVLEVTEGALVSYQADGSRSIDAVRALGVRWCIDDFGIGYSSLAYLNTLPVACMKIDRSFVSGGTGLGLANETIVGVILQLGRSLGIDVIAEGVETAAQSAALSALRCRALQGYGHAMPMSADAFARSPFARQNRNNVRRGPASETGMRIGSFEIKNPANAG